MTRDEMLRRFEAIGEDFAAKAAAFDRRWRETVEEERRRAAWAYRGLIIGFALIAGALIVAGGGR